MSLTGKTKKGFLLFEVMIAVVVLAVGLTFVLRSFNSAVSAVKAVGDYTAAMFLAQEKMFDVQTQGPQKTGAEGRFSGPFEKFFWSVDVSALEDLALDEVRVSVRWDTLRSTRTYSISTYAGREYE